MCCFLASRPLLFLFLFTHSHPYLYFSVFFQVGKNKKDPERLPIVKKFVAWWIERHYIKHPGERLCVLFDMSEAGFSNMVRYNAEIILDLK